MASDNIERDKSEFNSAISYLNRLNILLANCVECAIELDVQTWFHSLLALYRELSTEMQDHEIIKYNKLIEEINNKIDNYAENEYEKIVDRDLYKQLHSFEIDLRKIMKQSGLQQKIMDDASNALK